MKKEHKPTKNQELLKLLRETYEINTASDITNALKDLFKDTLQEAMNQEFEEHMGYPKNDKTKEKDNYRNGAYSKNIKSTYGNFPLEMPRDREGEFEPQIVGKYQRDISELEEKIIGLYGIGLSTRDISNQIQELYGINVSHTMISHITDAILPQIKQ